MINEPIKINNQGWIQYIDHYGDDRRIVQAARTSHGNEDADKTAAEDRKTMRYLIRHHHSTPFEMVDFTFRIYIPKDTWIQWLRHRTASINEYSTRYEEAIDEIHLIPEGEWRSQGTTNKQKSGDPLPRQFTQEECDKLNKGVEEHHHLSINDDRQAMLKLTAEDYALVARKWYETQLALGVSREQARQCLPLGTYTRAYWKCNLRNIFHFLNLRMSAQPEIAAYAQAMGDIVKQVVPIAYEAFEDYMLYSQSMSRMEMALLSKMVSDDKVMDLQSYGTSLGMSQREIKEFKEKLRIL